MKKTLFIIALLYFFNIVDAQVQLKHGLLIGGGKGSISTKIDPSYTNINGHTVGYTDYKYKANVSLGYRFRLNQTASPKTFLDIDVYAGTKSITDFVWFQMPVDGIPIDAYGSSGTRLFTNFSIAATYNYRIYKGLSAGIGIEPIFYIGGDKKSFDVPVVCKAGYDFKYFELSINCKYGLMNSIKDDYLKSGKFNDWQIQLFIPF
jgi:hypothetical protein